MAVDFHRFMTREFNLSSIGFSSVMLLALCLFGLGIAGEGFAQAGEGYIAFVSNRETNEDIFVTNSSGTVTYNLTNSRSRDWHPSWSNDGTRIVFSSDRSGSHDLFIMNADGSNVRNITNTSQSNETSPEWSPVNEEIAFVSNRGAGFDLYVLNLDTNETRAITTDGTPKSAPAWSPDGRSLVYWQQGENGTSIHTIDIDTGEINMIVEPGQNDWPAWSPDGTRIIFHSLRTGSADIYSVDINTGALTNITNSTSNDARPRWSPDGTRIIFMSDRDGNFELYVMNADGSAPRRLTETQINNHSPNWQPVPAEIIFDSGALGQNVSIVTGVIDPEAQQEFGRGETRLYAPEAIQRTDLIRVRLEVEASQLVEREPHAEPTEDPDSPLRAIETTTVYRLMGAELGGFDIGLYDVIPDPTSYMIELSEDKINYWEWHLRPRSGAVGTTYLTVTLFLPEEEREGVVVLRTLNRISFSIDVLDTEPAQPSAYIILEDEDASSLGFSIYYSDESTLTIAFTDSVRVDDMSIATENFASTLVDDFQIIANDFGGIVPPALCLRYRLENAGQALPRECSPETVLETPLLRGDIFWFDLINNQLRPIIIRKDGEVFICSTQITGRCDF